MSHIKEYSNRHGRVFQAQQHHCFDRVGQGLYQVTSLRFMRDQVPNARRIVDVGAHVGTSAMEYATWAETVETFECSPVNFACLEHNVRHNRNLAPGKPWYNNESPAITGDIVLHNIAAMDRIGTAYVNHAADGLADYVRYDRGAEAIRTITIDWFGWTDVDAIKLDTEGTEWLVIQGADQTIRRCRPVVQVEMWGWEKRFGLNNQDLLDYFRSLNYTQIDHYGREMPWDFSGKYNKALGNGRSAMDRFFIPN